MSNTVPASASYCKNKNSIALEDIILIVKEYILSLCGEMDFRIEMEWLV